MRATLAGDRLYALSVRPQEWDGLRDRAELGLRWGPLADDPGAPARRHWFLLVLEVVVRLPTDDPLAGQHPHGLEVLRLGWEAELELPVELPAEAIDRDEDLVGGLMGKAMGVVNAVAVHAGAEPLLTQAMLDALRRRWAGQG